MWPEKAKAIMRKTAIMAELVQKDDHCGLMLIFKFEAIALYCERKCNQFNLEHNDKFMICDTRNRTVDLIALETDESDERKLCERTKGRGQSCGSIFLDRRVPSAFESMMNIFIESIKSQFDGIEYQFITLTAFVNLAHQTDLPLVLRWHPSFNSRRAEKDVFEPVIKRFSTYVKNNSKKLND
ncbi:unnamed protein product [Rhizopus stolonifer]